MRINNPTHRSRLIGFAALAAALLAVQPAARADDDHTRKIPLEEAPAAVRETVLRIIGTGQFDELKRKFMLGKVVYKAEYLRDHQEHSALVNEAGEILQESVEIPKSELPAVVADAAKAAYPKGKVTEVDRVTADGKTFYEVSIDLPDDEEREVTFDPDGKILDDREDD